MFIAAISLTRGFTGHEHLDQVGLIHMGGRVYDPEIGRFLSPDPFVQFPASTQGFNRYAYVSNNPLSYTDPSGYFLKKLMKVAGIGMNFIPGWTLMGNAFIHGFVSGFFGQRGRRQGRHDGDDECRYCGGDREDQRSEQFLAFGPARDHPGGGVCGWWRAFRGRGARARVNRVLNVAYDTVDGFNVEFQPHESFRVVKAGEDYVVEQGRHRFTVNGNRVNGGGWTLFSGKAHSMNLTAQAMDNGNFRISGSYTYASVLTVGFRREVEISNLITSGTGLLQNAARELMPTKRRERLDTEERCALGRC